MKKFIYFILIVSLFIFSGCTKIFPEFGFSSFNQNEINYLKENSVLLETLEDYHFFDDKINDKRVVFTSEFHGTELNFELKMNMFKYLNENHDFNVYISETGYGSAFVINHYIRTGEEEYLDFLMNQLENTFSYSLNNYEYFKNMHEYYLETEKDFIFTGIDVEHQFATALLAIEIILDKIENNDFPVIFEDFEIIINFLRSIEFKRSGYAEDTSRNIIDFYSNLYLDYSDNETFYENIFGNDFIHLKSIVENSLFTLKLYYEFDKDDEIITFDDIDREVRIYDNFLFISQMYPDTNYYGQWGAFHTSLNIINEETLAYYINSNELFKDKVLSIYSYYINSDYLNPRDGKIKRMDNHSDYKLDKISKGNLTFFDLEKDNSPFTEKLYFLNIKNTDLSTTDFFQMFILFDNSKPIKIFNK